MEVYLSNSNKYHELVTTDLTIATAIYKLHPDSATLITHHCNDCKGNRTATYYNVSWLKDVGGVNINVDDNLYI